MSKLRAPYDTMGESLAGDGEHPLVGGRSGGPTLALGRPCGPHRRQRTHTVTFAVEERLVTQEVEGLDSQHNGPWMSAIAMRPAAVGETTLG